MRGTGLRAWGVDKAGSGFPEHRAADLHHFLPISKQSLNASAFSNQARASSSFAMAVRSMLALLAVFAVVSASASYPSCDVCKSCPEGTEDCFIGSKGDHKCERPVLSFARAAAKETYVLCTGWNGGGEITRPLSCVQFACCSSISQLGVSQCASVPFIPDLDRLLECLHADHRQIGASVNTHRQYSLYATF